MSQSFKTLHNNILYILGEIKKGKCNEFFYQNFPTEIIKNKNFNQDIIFSKKTTLENMVDDNVNEKYISVFIFLNIEYFDRFINHFTFNIQHIILRAKNYDHFGTLFEFIQKNSLYFYNSFYHTPLSKKLLNDPFEEKIDVDIYKIIDYILIEMIVYYECSKLFSNKKINLNAYIKYFFDKVLNEHNDSMSKELNLNLFNYTCIENIVRSMVYYLNIKNFKSFKEINEIFTECNLKENDDLYQKIYQYYDNLNSNIIIRCEKNEFSNIIAHKLEYFKTMFVIYKEIHYFLTTIFKCIYSVCYNDSLQKPYFLHKLSLNTFDDVSDNKRLKNAIKFVVLYDFNFV